MVLFSLTLIRTARKYITLLEYSSTISHYVTSPCTSSCPLFSTLLLQFFILLFCSIIAFVFSRSCLCLTSSEYIDCLSLIFWLLRLLRAMNVLWIINFARFASFVLFALYIHLTANSSRILARLIARAKSRDFTRAPCFRRTILSTRLRLRHFLAPPFTN